MHQFVWVLSIAGLGGFLGVLFEMQHDYTAGPKRNTVHLTIYEP